MFRTKTHMLQITYISRQETGHGQCGHNTFVVAESQLNSMLNPTLQNKFHSKFNEKNYTAS